MSNQLPVKGTGTPDRLPSTKSPKPTPTHVNKFTQNRTKSNPRTLAYIKYFVTIRPPFMGKMHDHAIPELAKLVYQEMLTCDHTALLLSNDALQQHKLDNIDDLPDTLDSLTPWVQNMRETQLMQKIWL